MGAELGQGDLDRPAGRRRGAAVAGWGGAGGSGRGQVVGEGGPQGGLLAAALPLDQGGHAAVHGVELALDVGGELGGLGPLGVELLGVAGLVDQALGQAGAGAVEAPLGQAGPGPLVQLGLGGGDLALGRPAAAVDGGGVGQQDDPRAYASSRSSASTSSRRCWLSSLARSRAALARSSPRSPGAAAGLGSAGRATAARAKVAASRTATTAAVIHRAGRRWWAGDGMGAPGCGVMVARPGFGVAGRLDGVVERTPPLAVPELRCRRPTGGAGRANVGRDNP
jgi:hypothetical protein